MMRTSNPALNENVFRIEGTSAANVMTIEGTAGKTMVLLGIVVLVAGIVWQMVYPAIAAAGAGGEVVTIPPNCWGFAAVGFIGGMILAVITIFKPNLAPISAPVYAAFEGLLLGAISAIFECMFPGIVPAAVVATFGVLATMLVAYRFRIIRVTQKFRMGVTAAIGGIMLVYIVNIVMILFGGSGLGMIYSAGWVGIGFSVFVVIIASLNLVLNFDIIEKGAAYGAPKYMEWYGGFGLLVALVWLYIEILWLLAKLQGRD